jgi:hypothetical protein
MGWTVKDKCAQIMDMLKSEMYLAGMDVPLSVVVKAIHEVGGYNRETEKQYRNALVDYNFLKRKGGTIFTIVDRGELNDTST